MWNAAGPLTIGRSKFDGRPGDFWPGAVDDVRVFDRALSAKEVAALANRRQGRWTLDEGAGTAAADSSGNGRVAVRAGGTSWSVGRFGGGMTFDGSSGHLATSGPVVNTSTTFTVSAWVRFFTALADAPPVVGEWAQLTGVYDADASRIQLWVNGVPTGSAAVPGHWTAIGPLTIGRARYHGNPTDFWPGDIDEVRAYSGVLNGPEIQALSANPPG